MARRASTKAKTENGTVASPWASATTERLTGATSNAKPRAKSSAPSGTSNGNGKVVRPGSQDVYGRCEQWLTHWVENIAAASVRPTTMVGYRASVYKHLIPGVGAHRLDKLQPEHLERLYERMVSKKGLKPATAHLAHRTVRVALNEAVRRGRIAQNPAKIARPPRVEEDEIIPFTVVEAQRLFTAAATMRNGARFVVALALGLRRGEALAWIHRSALK